MTTTITHQDLIARLEEQEIPYGELSLQNGVTLVISERGGRLFGPFLAPDAPGIFWHNPAMAEAATFDAFLTEADWNLGGERIWIAPEIQYSVHDRDDFWNSLQLPPQMDPGRWTLESLDDATWALSQTVTLEAHNIASGSKTLHVARRIRPTADPLRHLSGYRELLEGVTFAGYEHEVRLSETRSDRIMSESWNLVQLNPGGVLLIPTTAGVEYSDYFEPIDEEYQMRYPDHVRLRITGERRYKVGYKAVHLWGRLGYLNQMKDGRSYLLVRNFFNNPALPYVEEPAACPGCRGHSVHVYNDGGMFGGFGELECNGQTIGGETGRATSTDTFVLWLYVGPPQQIAAISDILLGLKAT